MNKYILLATAALALGATAYGQNGNVGIGTTNPQAKLHVQGNQILANTPVALATDNVSTLAKDNTTGEIKVIQTGSNAKLLSYVTYTFNNVALDYLQDFDTKIDTSKYFVLIVGFNYRSMDGSTVNLTVPNSTSNYYNPLNVHAFKNNGTWHIFADYFGGAPANLTGQYKWDIDLLVVHTSLVKDLGSIQYNMNSLPTGSAAAAPAGL